MAQTAEQLALANNAAKDLGFGNVTGAKDYLSSLPVESLSGSNPTFPDNNTTSNLSYEGVVSSAQNLLTETTNAANALNEQMKSGGAADKRVQDLMAAATGRGQETLDMEKQAGLDTQQKYLNDLNASILNKTTALEKAKLADQYAIMGLEGKGGVPLNIVRGQQARAQRDTAYLRQADAADLANLVATSDLLKGNIQTAKDNITRSIDLKYGDAEKALENEMFFYERNWDRMTAAEQKQAAARMEFVNAQKDAINQQKEDERSRFDFMAQASQMGADGATIQAIRDAKTLEEAAGIASTFIGKESRTNIALDRAKAQKALDEADPSFKFDKTQRNAFRSVLSEAQIVQLESDIKSMGAKPALEKGQYSDEVWDLAADVFGIGGMTSEEGLAAVNQMTPIPTEDQAYDYANNRPGYDNWGFWSGPQTDRYISDQTQLNAEDKAYYNVLVKTMSPQEALKKVAERAYK